jgi:hypothetical protein
MHDAVISGTRPLGSLAHVNISYLMRDTSVVLALLGCQTVGQEGAVMAKDE